MKTIFDVKIHAFAIGIERPLKFIARHNEGCNVIGLNKFYDYGRVEKIDSYCIALFMDDKHVLTITERKYIGHVNQNY